MKPLPPTLQVILLATMLATPVILVQVLEPPAPQLSETQPTAYHDPRDTPVVINSGDLFAEVFGGESDGTTCTVPAWFGAEGARSWLLLVKYKGAAAAGRHMDRLELQAAGAANIR